MRHRLPGTFARVWLTRLKAARDDRTGIYALKVLRKADGEEGSELDLIPQDG